VYPYTEYLFILPWYGPPVTSLMDMPAHSHRRYQLLTAMDSRLLTDTKDIYLYSYTASVAHYRKLTYNRPLKLG